MPLTPMPTTVPHRLALAAAFAATGRRSGVEIGVACGYYARVLCEAGCSIVAIDPWDDRKGRAHIEGGGNEMFRLASEALAPFLASGHAQLLRTTSAKARGHFPDAAFDFVFIDGCHDYEAVTDDIVGWRPKIRSGGIIAGHDYYLKKHRTFGGVVNAVNDYVAAHRLELHVTAWDRTTTYLDDRQPCWWFEQP